MSTIYILKDPLTKIPKYIGVTRRIQLIRKLHPSHWLPQSSKVYQWVKELHVQGLKPKLRKLRDVPDNEAYWIKYMMVIDYTNRGIVLLNADESEVNQKRSISQKSS